MYFFDVRTESVFEMIENKGVLKSQCNPETYVCIHFPMLMVVFCFGHTFSMCVSMTILYIYTHAQDYIICDNGSNPTKFSFQMASLKMFGSFWICEILVHGFGSTCGPVGAPCHAPDGSGRGGEGPTPQRGATPDE